MDRIEASAEQPGLRTGAVEGDTERENLAGADQARRLYDVLGRHVIERADLVVLAPTAPVLELLRCLGDRLFADLDVHNAVPSGLLIILQRAFPSMDARSRCNIALAAGVSASGVRRCRFDEYALLAHDPAHKHPFKKPAILEDIHETQFDCRCGHCRRTYAARAGEQHRRRVSQHKAAGATGAETGDGRRKDHRAPDAGRPRCLASIPAMKKLLDEARAHKVTIVYSI